MGCARDSLTNCALNAAEYSFLCCLSKSIFRSKSELYKLCASPGVYVDRLQVSERSTDLRRLHNVIIHNCAHSLQRSLLFTINAVDFSRYGLSVLQKNADLETLRGLRETLLLTMTQELPVLATCDLAYTSFNALDQALMSFGDLKALVYAYALVCWLASIV